MPVKLNFDSPADNAEARIEIIPLIDIMFFLLAAFMLVSLSMVNLKSVKVNLPTAVVANSETRKEFVDISVDKAGAIYLDTKAVSDRNLLAGLSRAMHENRDVRVFISGDRDARHGNVIHVLDLVRSLGIEKVAFEIRQPQKDVQP